MVEWFGWFWITWGYMYIYIYTYIHNIHNIYNIYKYTLPPWLRKPPSSITCHGDPRWPTCGGTSKASSVGVAVPLSVGVAGTLRASMVVGLNPTRWCMYIWLLYMLIHIILYVNVMMLIHIILSLIVFYRRLYVNTHNMLIYISWYELTSYNLLYNTPASTK